MKILSAAIIIAFTTITCLPVSAQGKKVQINKKPSWIAPVTFDADAKPPEGQESGYYYLLLDEQESVSRQERYFHFAYQVLTSDGVQAMSDITLEWDPVYQQLHLHEVKIHRNGKVINQVSNSLQVIQREQSMDRYLYDGSLTAVMNLRDVRAGDIIEYSYTRKGYNPVYGGHLSRKIYFDFTVPYEKFFQRLLVPEDFPLDIHYRNTDIKPTVKTNSGLKEYTWELKKTRALILDNNTPAWYEPNQHMAFTDFSDWKGVASWAVNHFRVGESQRRVLKERISKTLELDDEEAFVLAAIRFVQDEIRYLGFESGLNSHKPHAPLEVLDQRFGDCKDKSLLLCEILRTKGIEASPVLVSTVWRNRVADEVPSINAFNHCVVRLEVGDRIHYVDPTLNNQGGRLENIYFPNYGKGLVVDESTDGLSDLPSPVTSDISEVQTISVPTIGGEAYLEVRTTYTGGQADRIRGEFLNNSLESIQKNYLTYYGNLYPDIEVAKPIKTQDSRDGNIFSIDETYKIPTFWEESETSEGLIMAEVYPLTMESYFNVSKSSHRAAPYALNHPTSYHHSIHIKLPEAWNVETDEQFINSAYYQYEYHVGYQDKEITLRTHYETLADHIPMAAFDKFVSDHGKMMDNLSFRLSYKKNLIANEKGISWLGVITALCTVGFGLWLMLRIYYYFDPQPTLSSPLGGQQIGGWLILPAIGLTISPFRMAYEIFNLPQMYDSQMWANLWDLKQYGLVALIFFEHIYNLLFLLYAVLIVILFYKRRSSLPRLITIYYSVSCIVVTIDAIVSSQYGGSGDEANHFVDMIRSILTAAIWIPYFNASNRVKETFVKRISDDDDDLRHEAVGVGTYSSEAPERM